MPKTSSMRFEDNPGMIFFISFIVVAVVNYLVVWLAGSWYPENIVIGNVSLTMGWATALFAAALSLLTVLFLPFLRMWEHRIKRPLMPLEMMLVYFVFNFVAVWLITRKSEVFGVGVTSWWVVLGLAAVLDFVQGMAMMQVEKWKIQE